MDELNDEVKIKMRPYPIPAEANIYIRKIIAYADGDIRMNYKVKFMDRWVTKNVSLEEN